MSTINYASRLPTGKAASEASHFALIEKFSGTIPSEAPATQPIVPSSALKGLLREASDRALHGSVGRISADQLMADWKDFFTPDEIFATVMPARTFARRKAKGEPLTIEETERALRLARVAMEAQRVFANPVKSSRWLRKPNRALNKQTPLALLETETGARAVEELLGQIDHGIYI